MDSLSRKERAAWVLMGDPYAKVPSTLASLAERIEYAIRQAVEAEREATKTAREERDERAS